MLLLNGVLLVGKHDMLTYCLFVEIDIRQYWVFMLICAIFIFRLYLPSFKINLKFILQLNRVKTFTYRNHYFYGISFPPQIKKSKMYNGLVFI